MSRMQRLRYWVSVKRVGIVLSSLAILGLAGCSSESTRLDFGFSESTGSTPVPAEPVYGYDDDEGSDREYRHYSGTPSYRRAQEDHTGASYHSERYSDRYEGRDRYHEPHYRREVRYHERDGRSVIEHESLPPVSEPDYGRPKQLYRRSSHTYHERPKAPHYARRERPAHHDRGRKYVTVRRGDTVYSIADSHGVSVGALMKENRLPTTDIRPGQRLVIPEGSDRATRPDPGPLPSLLNLKKRAKASSAGGSYKVRMGDTLYSVARKHGMRAKDLAAYNGIDDPSVIRVGQVLRIPGGDVTPPVRVARTAKRRERKVASLDPRDGLPSRTSHDISSAYRHREKPADLGAASAGGSTPDDEPLVVRSAKGDRAERLRPRRRKRVEDRLGDDIRSDEKAEETRLAARTEPKVASAPKPRSCTSLLNNPPARSGANFRRPAQGLVISGFGSKPDGTRNDGINISVPRGTPVKAAENGVVVYAGNELSGYGNLVLVRHADGWVSAYAHNDKLLVRRCDTVKRGQMIARAGMTGSVNKPQLHFELRKDSHPVNPEGYFAGTS